MNIRLISGAYRGRKLDAPDNARTHPMGERVRSSLFNIIAAELPGAHVLDAFAGTGSLGFEALSRGAAHVSFVERDRIANRIIKKNALMLNCVDRVRLYEMSVKQWSDGHVDDHFDIIFADPPYYDMQLSTVKILFKHLNAGALMVLSQPGRGEMPTEMGIVVVDNRSYGTAALTFYRRE